MKTFNGRVEDIYNNGITSCDGYNLEEIHYMLINLKTIFEDKSLAYFAAENAIKEVLQ
jgi:hypothetical protein